MRQEHLRIIVLIVVGVLIVSLYPIMGNLVANLAQQWLGDEIASWKILLPFIVLSALAVYYGMLQYIKPTEHTLVASLSDERNRAAMLAKVRQTWITDFLDRSVAREARILLQLQTRPDAVIEPVDLTVQRPDRPAEPVPTGTPILSLYDQFNRVLLILGAPGAGKTTLLLELTRDLLTRADSDPNHPIPVVFPLSTWASEHKPLAAWLNDELVRRYQIPRAIAQRWIDTDAILPLLDGLDEVAEEHRNACADAINSYRQTRGTQPLVVSSRSADYDALTSKLQLHGAIVAQPLTREQVRTYLRAVGIPAIPRSDSPLWELLDTPLMLTVAALAYAGQPIKAIAAADPVAAQQHLFSAYIERMFTRNNPQRPFTDAQTRYYLTFLAHQMQQHNQTTFYLEQMQPDWLPPPHRRRWNMLVHLSGGLLGGLLSVFVFGLFFGLDSGLRGALLGALVFGLFGALVGTLGMRLNHKQTSLIGPTETVRWSWREARLRLSGDIGSTQKGWLVSMLIFVVVYFPLNFGLLGGLVSGLFLGLFLVLTAGLSEHTIEQKTTPNQGFRRSGINALLAALVSGLMFGLVLGLMFALNKGTNERLNEALLGGLSGGLFGALFGGFAYGGRAYIQHYVLRFLLIRNGSLPRRLVPLLDYATQRILLRRVGGGYIFIHRLLLEHFAAEYEQEQGSRPPTST